MTIKHSEQSGVDSDSLEGKLSSIEGISDPQAELEKLSKVLDDELKASAAEHVSELKAAAAAAKSPNDNTQEFIRLADFVKKEHQKKTLAKDPEQQKKVRTIDRYKEAKSKQFEQDLRQKGLQVNKAA